MIKRRVEAKSSINTKCAKAGVLLEHRVAKILSGEEAITDRAPLVYMERKDGVLPAYNPRTDRFDMAIDAMDINKRIRMSKRMEKAPNSETGANAVQSTQATS